MWELPAACPLAHPLLVTSAVSVPPSVPSVPSVRLCPAASCSHLVP